MLDQALYPRPHDAFGSVQQRIEVYGLDPDDSDFESAAEEEEIQHADDIYSTCQTNSRQYILNRQSSAVEKFVQALEPEHRHILISYLVSTTLESGGASDATFVATLFSLEGIRCLCDRNVFIEGFTSEVALLDDTSIDIPQAYQLMAIMLIGSPLNLDAVEELTSNLRSLDVKDRLMDTYTTLDPNSEVDTSNRTSSQEALFGREYNDVERSRPSSGRMYAH